MSSFQCRWANTLLRLAEEARLYVPKWSHWIMDEVTRNLIEKWGLKPQKARRRESEIQRHFPEASVKGFEPLVDVMTNDAKDRHVLADAVRSYCELIVTYNHRHYPSASVQPWEIEVQAPSAFLHGLYDLDADLFVHKLLGQAQAIGIKLEHLLQSLRKNAPRFVQYFCEEQRIGLP